MTEAIIAGFLLGIALIFSVGPVIFTILKLRINYGITSAFYFIAGVWLSDIIWIILANFFSALLGDLIQYKNIIGISGSFFLIGLSIFYLFFKKYRSKEEIDMGIKINSTIHIKLFITGFLINTLNPAVIALWFAAATKSISNTFNERVIIFAICLTLNISADILKIKVAGRIRNKLTEKNINIINKISGFIFLVFGLILLFGVIMSYTKN
jgi:threonine/homoserine/homoserine lactone efflux protein